MSEGQKNSMKRVRNILRSFLFMSVKMDSIAINFPSAFFLAFSESPK